MPVTGILLFAVPNAPEEVQVIWVMLSYNLFYSFEHHQKRAAPYPGKLQDIRIKHIQIDSQHRIQQQIMTL